MLILVANAVIAIWQDSNADSALEALKNMQAVKSLVLRDGEWHEHEATLLVPGDIVKVVQGDRVPADVRICHMESVSF